MKNRKKVNQNMIIEDDPKQTLFYYTDKNNHQVINIITEKNGKLINQIINV